jgi:hypothetical protein
MTPRKKRGVQKPPQSKAEGMPFTFSNPHIQQTAAHAAWTHQAQSAALHQNPAETLHIRRLENGIERPCAEPLLVRLNSKACEAEQVRSGTFGQMVLNG